MCGIAGVLGLDGGPASHLILRRMTDAMAHRGPDADGIYVDGALGLGHRRLAIIDLTPAGSQPMQTRDARFVISYNGEVFNFQELRVELEAHGHRFRSHSDTEVVLEAFAEWGLDALPRLNGMFAVAVWDSLHRELWLARDRCGIKPLYYVRLGDTLAFASEIKALLAHPDMRAQLDEEALVEYLTFQNLFTDRTLFAGVRLLAPGSFLRVRVGAEPDPPRAYWAFSFDEPVNAAPSEDYLEELDRLFRQAVSRSLISDVPVGAYLSGGMDSGSIAAVARPHLPELRTFTVGFDMHSASGIELGFDEREGSEHLSYLIDTEHYEMVLKAGDMERAMRELVWHLEEPRVGQSYPNYYAAKLASRFGKVVLSGAGGDELFGGYPWRYYRAVVNDDFDHYVSKYYGYWQRLLNESEVPRMLGPIWPRVSHVDTKQIFRQVLSADEGPLSRPEDYINHSLEFEARTFLHGLLVVEDKLSMAHGLETRLPFLDNDLVEFAQRVPVREKLGNLGEIVRLNENEPGPKTQRFFAKTRDGKLLLRRAMARHIPDRVTTQVKQGFSAPDATWFRGDSIDYVRRRLLGRDAAIFDFLDRSTVHMHVNEHLAGRRNRRLLIWSLLCLEEWCDVFLAGSSAERGSAGRSHLVAHWSP